MKAGKSAIRPWMSCPYNDNTLLDLPSSVVLRKKGFLLDLKPNLHQAWQHG